MTAMSLFLWLSVIPLLIYVTLNLGLAGIFLTLDGLKPTYAPAVYAYYFH
ncbi:hypothetical protein PSAR109036_02520 [Psychrobacter arenosus]